MLITDTLTALCLILGVLLALFGVAGFAGNWTSHPDFDSLRYTQVLATIGRRMACTGIALRMITHGPPSGATLPLFLCIAAAAGATYLTRTSHQIIPAGAARGGWTC